ncbi:MAG: hypothetical protein COV46_01285, partial [Deltaproteobacteria bacterium CG11_big_fil_rev_8_21_14_0_20_49_13]
ILRQAQDERAIYGFLEVPGIVLMQKSKLLHEVLIDRHRIAAILYFVDNPVAPRLSISFEPPKGGRCNGKDCLASTRQKSNTFSLTLQIFLYISPLPA